MTDARSAQTTIRALVASPGDARSAQVAVRALIQRTTQSNLAGLNVDVAAQASPESRLAGLSTDVAVVATPESRLAGYSVDVAVPFPSYWLEVLADSPKGFWPLEEPSGNFANYLGLPIGTVTGAVTRTAPSGLAFSSQSVGFTGTTTYVTLGAAGDLHSSSRTAFSWECWFKCPPLPTGISTGQGQYQIFGTDSFVDSFSNLAWSLMIERHSGSAGFGWVSAWVSSGVTRSSAYNTAARLDDNNWHHAVGTYDGANVRLYVDGALSATTAQTGNLNIGTRAAVLGLNHYYSGAYPEISFPGAVDEVAVYTSVLSPTRIAAHYTAAGYTPVTGTRAQTARESMRVAVKTVGAAQVARESMRVAVQTAGAAQTSRVSMRVAIQAPGGVPALYHQAVQAIVSTADAALYHQAIQAVVYNSLITSTTYTDAVLADGPVMYLPMQETSGTAAYDVTSNLRHGSYVSGTVVNDATDAAPPTVIGKHVRLDGTDDHVALATGSWFNPTIAGFTFEGWYYVRSWTAWCRVFDFGNTPSVTDTMLMYNNNTTVMNLFVNNSTALTFPKWATNTWVHFACTVTTSGATKVYINGSEVASGTTAAPTSGTRDRMYLGKSQYPADTYLPASVCHAALYHAVLSPTRIQAHATSVYGALPTPVAATAYSTKVLADGPMAYWRLEESSGDTWVLDYSGNGRHGIRTGGTYVSSVVDSGKGAQFASNGTDKIEVSGTFGSLLTLTMECWFKADANPTGSTRYLVTAENNSLAGTSRAWSMFVENNGSIGAIAFSASTASYVSSPAVSYCDGYWHHVLATHDGTRVILYIDGAWAGTGSAISGPLNNNTATPLRIGSSASDNAAFPGIIDEVAIYPKVLPGRSIMEHSWGSITSDSPYMSEIMYYTPRGYWKLDEASGNYVNQRPGALPGTVTGTVTRPSPGVLGGSTRSVGFPTTSDYVTFGGNGYLHSTSKQAFTWECWMKVSTITVDATGQSAYQIFGSESYYGSWTNATWGFFINRRTDQSHTVGFITACVAAGGNAKSFAWSNWRLDDDSWHHLVGTYDGTYVKLFVDGLLHARTARTGDINVGTHPATLGLNYANGNPANAFPGVVDEVAVYPFRMLDLGAATRFGLVKGTLNYTNEVMADAPAMYLPMQEIGTYGAATSVYTSQTPGTSGPAGTTGWTFGVHVTSTLAGRVTGLKFYRDATATETTRMLRLWTSSGELLGSANTSGESGSGWKTAMLSTPVEIAAGVTYIVSYDVVASSFIAYTTGGGSGTLTNGVLTRGQTRYITSQAPGVFPSFYSGDTGFIDVIFEPQSSSVVTDVSGNGHHATFVGSVGVNDFTDASGPLGLGKHVRFDGVNDYVLLEGGSWFNTASGFTLEGWFYNRSFPDYLRWFDFSNVADTNDIVLYTHPSGNNGFMTGGTAFLFPRWGANVWTHIAVTCTSTGVATIYVDGTWWYNGTNAAPGTGVRDRKFIGKSNFTGADPYLPASLCHVAIYPTVLSQARIQAHRIAAFTPPAPPPTGPAFRVWNGTAEIAATPTVWTGTAEVPATGDISP